ncbi:MAG: protocatechuate 3,4-dioxygenase subunit beta [Pseudomonadota bacterium]
MATLDQDRKRDWSVHPAAAPSQPLVPLRQTLSEVTGPVFGHKTVRKIDADLTKNAAKKGGEAIGERLILTGRVTDEANRPVPGSLIEVWQTNAAGLYGHKEDQHDAPIDPNFYGTGRCVTDEDGRYRFVTIRPGAYPVVRLGDIWRPAHIHLSLTGGSFAQRLITQCYFPGDPLQADDFVFQAVTNKAARERLIVKYAPEHSVQGYAVGYTFDIVLRGRDKTPMES